MRIFVAAACLALRAAVPAHAEVFELSAGNLNSTFIPPSKPPEGGNKATVPPTLNSNFMGAGSVTGSSGPVSTSAVHGDRYSSNPANTIVMTRSTAGGMFASGTPLYYMGDEILPPLSNASGQEFAGATDEAKRAAARAYWRAQPALPGENLPLIGGVQIPLGSLLISSADTNTTTVIAASTSTPDKLAVGAVILGQPIAKIAGSGPYTITLAGKPNENITANATRPITPATQFYYSKHADKVFASQPGQVSIIWVSVGLDAKKLETFTVAASTLRPVRSIYWTEGSFDGPKVKIADARVSTVNPIYYSAVPKAVAEEVNIPGNNPLISNLNTLYFDKFNGIGQLHAYNVEGRILIEYLGSVRQGDIYEFLGTDVVEVKREPDVYRVSQNLGTEIRPRTPAEAGDELLEASPVLTNAQAGASYYGTATRPDGSLIYYAERETSAAADPDNGEPVSSNAYNKVVFYWMESPPDNFGIKWPKFQTRYWQRWSPDLADYAHYTVDASGSTAQTGIAFPGGVQPAIAWQDDPAQAEAKMDVNSQRLFVTFASGNDRNRSLLKFTSSDDVWYVNLYTQAENRRETRVAQSPPLGFDVTVYDNLADAALLNPISNLLLSPGGVASRTAAAIDYNGNFNFPGLTAPETFSVTWMTYFDVSRDGPGDYTFGTNSDDGSMIYIDLNRNGVFGDAGELVVNNNGLHGPQQVTGTVNLASGLYPMILAFYEFGGGELMNARWKKGANVAFASLNTIQAGTGPFVTQGGASGLMSVGDTTGLEAGMVVTGSGITGNAVIRRIIDRQTIEISQVLQARSAPYNLSFSVESDGAVPIDIAATVGTRLTPPAGHEPGGYISSGTNYFPGGYLNPFTAGVAAAASGAVIPVNDLAADKVLTVRWFKKVTAPSSDFPDLYVPGKTGRYTVSFPSATNPQIVMAQGIGTGELAPDVATGSVYYQNSKALPGYNPNEEHAIMVGGRAYALRDDLNMISPQQSQPFVLIAYINAADRRPDMKVYKVLREIDANNDRIVQAGDILFDRPAVAGTLLVAPYPLPLMQLPLDENGVCANTEVPPAASGLDPRINSGAPASWDFFTKKDRHGFHWIYRGPHDGVSTAKRIAMQYKYVSRTGFFLPNASGTGSEITPGTILPYLRPLSGGVPAGNPVTGEPLTINFIPAWPANAPELRVGESLTLAKFGLPQVRGQASAQVLYEQSRALATAKASVTLHDPTAEKTVQLAAQGLEELPQSIATTTVSGKVYFQRLAPDLQERIWLDPLRAPDASKRPGTLVLIGQFKDEVAGEDYLHLNVLTEAQIKELHELCTETGAVKEKWINSINSLTAKVDTYIENPDRRGTYKIGSSETVENNRLVKITNPDTAKDSYALTATGEGAGWVTMLFGDGKAFTPEGDPVQVKVFKVAPALYTGELKVITSKNPLDEKVVLRHTGDFAARPQDYEFEWRWAPGSPTAPATYTTSWMQRIGGTNNQWSIQRNPSAAIGNAVTQARAVQVTGADPGEGLDLSGVFPYAVNIGSDGALGAAGGVTFSADSVSGVTISAGQEVLNHHAASFGPAPADTVLANVFRSIRWANANNPVVESRKVKVDLASLIPGRAYRLQLLFGDNSAVRRFDISVEGSLIMKDFSSLEIQGGPAAGAAVVYDLVAADSTLNIVLDGTTATAFTGIDRNAILNGLTLEDLSGDSSVFLSLPRSIVVKDSGYNAAGSPPGLLLTKLDPLDFAGGVPGEIAFSATMGEFDGFVLYINDVAALAHQAPASFSSTDALSGIVPGNLLPRQFRVPRSYFKSGSNTIKVAVFTGADVNAFSYLDFRLDVTQEVDVVAGTFQSVSDPLQQNTNVATIGADPALPFGGSTFVLNDRWYTMRYKPRTGVTNVAGAAYSRWMPPQLVEGWIKRVLREINPFEQRVKDLFNNAISTDSSVLTQAGTRWEGDVPLTLANIESTGLIAIYETVLNRARSMSIDANTNDPDTNNALMLAAGYLSDLYAILGNEAFADAANPTISTDDPDEATEINTSRFSFENQVSSSLDEELALLRGRDASGTRVDVPPAYNRLYWNYTGGINAGEAIYATNYNIKEKAGSTTADGVIDAADAQRMFPQGHGDAYGHYLTGLTGYYRLLANPNFTWQRRAEAVLVLGQAITVDFVDERKFAGDAAALARTAGQICGLVHRQQYKDGAAGWEQYRDTAVAPNTTEKRNWGLDEWTSRSAQGAYYHWVAANAMLPDVDTFHTGVEKIDRTTVPELNELATAISTFQTASDNASARLNPLGLSPGAIQFDIDPTFLEVGSTAGIGNNAVQGLGHFGQIYERALKAVVNAAGAFQQAARMTRSLRSQENQVDDYNSLIVDQERTFRNQLIEIYGRPYEGDVGPGKGYPQGYYGPDLDQWFVVDRPNDLVDTTSADSVKLRVWRVTDREFKVPALTAQGIINDYNVFNENGQEVRKEVEVTAYKNQFIQYSDIWLPGLGKRPETGELQAALLEAHRSYLVLKDALYEVKVLQYRFKREGQLLLEAVQSHQQHLVNQEDARQYAVTQLKIQRSLDLVAEASDMFAEGLTAFSKDAAEALPGVVGFALDATSGARSALRVSGSTAWLAGKITAGVVRSAAGFIDVNLAGKEMELAKELDALGFSLEEKQQAYELENLYRELTLQEYTLAHPLAAYQAANEQVASILARGLRIQDERNLFRQRAAAVVQGYRTKDVTFRVFRNEALEQYRSLFDLCSRYTYMAAKAYDYETGLLGSTEGQAFISSIVSSRSLGDVRDGDVFATASNLGDNGMAGAIARLFADYEVAIGRLGINNPDIYSTIFSLRGENFRIVDDPGQTADDEAWQQTLEQFIKANVLTDPDVATWCRNVKKPNGAPVPGIIIPFSTTIQHGLNFFGLPLAAGDHAFSASNFSTKIQSLGIALPGYLGMDEYSVGDPNAGVPALNNPDALSATPYVYVIPTGTDYLYAPPLGDQNIVRGWLVEDQAIPLPFNLGASAFNSNQIFNASGTLTEKPWVLRQHQAFRAVSDPQILLGDLPTEFTSRRLIGRSAWNSGWKIVIPAYTLLNNEQEGLSRFARTVRDVRIFIRTYSNSGN